MCTFLSFFFPCLFISALGAAYGTAKSGTGIAAMSVMRPDLIMKSVIPVVMAGIIAIYGLVVSVLIANKCKWSYPHVCMCRGITIILCFPPTNFAFMTASSSCLYKDTEIALYVYPIYISTISSGVCVRFMLGKSWYLVHSVYFNKSPHCTAWHL